MRKILIVLFIFILAFSIRFVHIVTHQHKIESDEVEYDRLAMNLVVGKGYIDSDKGAPTSLRPPLYPAILALSYKIFGHDFFAVKLIQAFTSALTVSFLYLIAYKIFNSIVAILTGIFSSFYMAFVMCARLLYTETFFTFLLVFTSFLVITADKPNIMRFCMLGFLCGFLTLMKSTAFFMPFVVIFFLTFKTWKNKLFLKKIFLASLALLICFASFLLPWTIRNYMVHRRLVFVSTNAGLNMYQGVTWTPGKLFSLEPDSDIEIKAQGISNQAERNDFYIRAAIKIYKEKPLFSLKMLLMRFLFFWNIFDWEIIGGNTINYHFIFIFPFALLGIFFGFKNRQDILFILLMVLYFTSFTLLFPGVPRYRMPIDGYIIMFGSYGIYGFINRERKAIPLFCAGSYFFFTYLLYRYSAETKFLIRSLMERLGLWI